MAHCPQCSAKVLSHQASCAGCGAALPDGGDEAEGPDPLLGRTLVGNFEIQELLDEGSMGRVYRARQISLDKMVAIKVLHQHLAADRKVARRFHREARAASRLSHPNSIHIFDFGETEDGTLYIAMELLDGSDLLAVLEARSPVTPRWVVTVMRQVLSALEEAHHAGIVHRDLKPENVIVLQKRGGEEHVKVCDFGIAKVPEAESGSSITVSGFVCGTPEYMAPEQARGEELDARADLYAAGCMLYQLLTGEVPFRGDSTLGTLTKHLTDAPVPPRKRRPGHGIPAALEAVCLKAMAKDRGERYGSAAEMSDALADALAALGAAADVPMGPVDGAEDASASRGEPSARADTGPSGGAPSAPPSAPTPSGGGAELAAIGGRRGGPWRAGALAAVAAALLLGWLALGSDRGPVETTGTGATTSALGGVGGAASVPDVATTPAEPARPDDRTADDPGTVEVRDAAAGAAGLGSAPVDAGGTSPRRADGPHPGRAKRGEPTVSVAAPTPTTVLPAVPVAEPSPGERAYTEGRRLLVANDLMSAIRALDEAARLLPTSAAVFRDLGRACMRAGQSARGAAAYRRYLELAPDAPDRAIIERIVQQSR